MLNLSFLGIPDEALPGPGDLIYVLATGEVGLVVIGGSGLEFRRLDNPAQQLIIQGAEVYVATRDAVADVLRGLAAKAAPR